MPAIGVVSLAILHDTLSPEMSEMGMIKSTEVYWKGVLNAVLNVSRENGT